MKIRQFERQDLQPLIAIQNKTPESARWLEADYIRLTSDAGGIILVAELETMTPPRVMGFVAFLRLIDEAELLNMAVDPEHRHQGVGKALLDEARKRLLQAGTKQVFLEVRRSNKTAQGLYFAAGFGLHSMRKDYYRDPPEDAYVLSLQL